MPRKTDASRPADWIEIAEADLAMVRLAAEREVSFAPCPAALAHPLVNVLTEAYFTDRYPGFDLDDPDWPTLTQEIEDVGKLLVAIKGRLAENC